MNENENFEGFEDISFEEEDIKIPDFGDDEPTEKPENTQPERKPETTPVQEEKLINFDELYKKIMIRIGERLKIIHNITYQDRIKILTVEILNDLELLNELIKAKLGGE
ncbi:hypothetical protein [Methanotorris igneus]|nr:hypothetical protein [Methanotorris igneus]